MPTTAQTPFKLDTLDAPLYFPFLVYRNLPHWELLCNLGPTLSVSKGYYFPSTPGAIYCYLVTAGMIESLANESDHLINHSAFFMEGSLFQEPSALSGLPSLVSYKAVTDTSVVRIERDTLKAAMGEDDRIFDLVLRSITTKLNASHEQQRETYLFDIRARIYFMLLGIASTAGHDGGEDWYVLDIKFTQQQMSEMLGVNRVTVNTALQELYDANVVCKREGRYAVYDGRHFIEHAVR